MWRDVDKLRTLAEELVDAGIVDRGDYEATVEVTLALAVQWGHLDENETRQHLNASATTKAEQRAIVEEYVRFARETNSPAKRSHKIRSLGVSPQTLTRWARWHFGSGYLARSRPTPTAELVLEHLRAHPWQTRAQILERTGVVRTSIPGALDWLRRKGQIQRRTNGRGRLEFAAC